MKQKIFGIGLNKTGTKTLHECGKILGYDCYSCDKDLLEDVTLKKYFGNILTTVEKYNFFEDWPWPLIYKELDYYFPSSKFILTVRKDAFTWYESLKKHSLRTHPVNHCRKLAYGYNYPHCKKWEHVLFYLRHNEIVNRHFVGRRNDFIELCWEEGDRWDKLCNFLGKNVPNVPFPHMNKGSEVKNDENWVLINKILSGVGD
jgi:hypothetical protein